MKRAENVTIRVSKLTKVALDIYQAKQYARTGVYMTNDESILELLKSVDSDSVNTARKAGADTEPPKRTGGKDESK